MLKIDPMTIHMVMYCYNKVSDTLYVNLEIHLAYIHKQLVITYLTIPPFVHSLTHYSIICTTLKYPVFKETGIALITQSVLIRT